MPLASFVRPWTGLAFRHIPAASPYHVLDFRFAGQAGTNRWNYRGQPTLYLASDMATALAEFARHLRDNRARELASGAVERAVFRLELSVDSALDLRDPAVLRELSLREAPGCFLDRAIARAVAEFVRRTTEAQALLVPSMAFLDDPNRWIVVLFLEKLPVDPRDLIRAAVAEGSFRVESP